MLQGSTGSGDPTLQAHERVRQRLVAHLRETDSPFAQDAVLMNQLLDSCTSILVAVEADLAEGVNHLGTATPALRLGRSRAAQGVHPGHSLNATLPLFVLALEELSALYPEQPPSRIAARLNAQINASVSSAATGYVDLLLERLSKAQSEERRRIARDMHDRVAHEIGAGTMAMEVLLSTHEDQFSGEIIARLVAIQEQLRAATDVVRSVATDLRDMVSGSTLEDALRRYVQFHVPPPWEPSLHFAIDHKRVPSYVAEQTYLIAREAVRNAVLHAKKADQLSIEAATAQHTLELEVMDNGLGFAATNPRSNSTGLLSMKERALALDGSLDVSSTPNVGTRVTLKIPLEGSIA